MKTNYSSSLQDALKKSRPDHGAPTVHPTPSRSLETSTSSFDGSAVKASYASVTEPTICQEARLRTMLQEMEESSRIKMNVVASRRPLPKWALLIMAHVLTQPRQHLIQYRLYCGYQFVTFKRGHAKSRFIHRACTAIHMAQRRQTIRTLFPNYIK